MNVELFTGSPDDYKTRLEAIIAGAGAINFTFPSHQKGTYVIMWT